MFNLIDRMLKLFAALSSTSLIQLQCFDGPTKLFSVSNCS